MKGILPCCIINLPVRITHTLYNADKRENGLLCNNYCNKTLGIRTIVFGNSTVVPLLTCSKHVCAFILKKELRPKPKQYSCAVWGLLLQTKGQHAGMKLTFIEVWLTEKTDGKSQVNNVVRFFCCCSFSVCTACSSKCSRSVQHKHSSPVFPQQHRWKTNNLLKMINLVVIFIKEGLRSVPPLRQGSLKRQTQERRSRKTKLKLYNIIIDL